MRYTLPLLLVGLLGAVQVVFPQMPAVGWARALNADGYDNIGRSIALDLSGNVYVAGSAGGSTLDLDPGPGTDIHTLNSGSAPVIIKLDNNGNYLWGAAFSGTDEWSDANIVLSDPQGNVLIAGSFKGTLDFDPGPSSFTLSSDPDKRACFLVKLTSTGSFVWAKCFNGILDFTAMDVDDKGTYLAGSYMGTADFDPDAGVQSESSANGSMDGFFLKLDNQGSFVSKGTLTGPGTDYFTCLKVHPDCKLLIAGETSSICDLDPGLSVFSVTNTSTALTAFIGQYDLSGNFLSGASLAGGGSQVNALEVDANKNVLVGGSFFSQVDLDLGPGLGNQFGAFTGAIFVAKYDRHLNLSWSKTANSPINTTAQAINAIDTDASGDIYCFGNFHHYITFDPGSAVDSLHADGNDMFIAKIDAGGNLEWTSAIGGPVNSGGHWPDDHASDIAVSAQGDVYTTGRCSYGTDFDPSASWLVVSQSENDLFIYKLNGNSTVGFREKSEEQFSIFPNPTSGVITLNAAEGSSIMVTDISGRQVPAERDAKIVDISGLQPGVYYLTIGCTETSSTVKVIKE